jgi:hypothetical protein
MVVERKEMMDGMDGEGCPDQRYLLAVYALPRDNIEG